jgi:hypothetical protein
VTGGGGGEQVDASARLAAGSRDTLVRHLGTTVGGQGLGSGGVPLWRVVVEEQVGKGTAASPWPPLSCFALTTCQTGKRNFKVKKYLSRAKWAECQQGTWMTGERMCGRRMMVREGDGGAKGEMHAVANGSEGGK